MDIFIPGYTIIYSIESKIQEFIMKTSKCFLYPLVLFCCLFIFSISIHADTEPNNNSCPTGEVITDISSPITGTVTDGSDTFDRYSYTVPSSGTLKIAYTSSRNTRVWFTTDSSSGCRHNKILDSGKSTTSTINVNTGDTVYIVTRERFGGSHTSTYQFSLTLTNANNTWVPNSGLNSNGSSRISLDLNKDFTLIYGGAGNFVKGDFVATGNTIMDGDKSTTYFAGSTPTMLNDNNALSDLGTSVKNKNSSAAPLSLPPYVTTDHIIWAGLFWQAQIDDDAGNTNEVDTETAGWNTVHMRTPDGTIHEITAPLGTKNQSHSTYHYAHFMNGDYRYFYSAYVDVTNIIKNSGYTPSNNIFTVGNIMATDGTDTGGPIYFNHINEPSGAWYNLHMGHFGGWSLIVVYDVDNATMALHPDEVKYRNISIYNGYDLFSFWTGNAGDRFETTLTLSGFKTPKEGSISSKMLFFGGGGDYGMDHDTLQIEKGYAPGTFADLTNSKNLGTQKFNGTYTDFDNNIIPGKSYFQGMDLDIFDTSSYMKNDQTSTKIKFGVIQQPGFIDQVFPQTIAFSTELFKPKVCYDYAIYRNDFALTSSDKEINSIANPGDKISILVAIRSFVNDLDLKNSLLGLTLHPIQGNMLPQTAYYSRQNSSVLLPTMFTSSSTAIHPTIAIGKTRDINNGGTIGAFERYFAKFDFNVTSVNNNQIENKFDIDLNTTLTYGGGNYNFLLQLERCPQTETYNPEWLQFNVEPHLGHAPTTATERYSLLTQIAARDFDYDVVSYGPTGDYTVETPIDGVTVDVELINADAFDDNTSILKCSNPDDSIIYGGFGNSPFVTFHNQSRVEMTDPSDMANTQAIRNAVFRIWVLADENNTIIPHTYHRNEGDKFKTIYDTYYRSIDLEGSCSTACNSTNGVAGKTDCYNCLRRYFATPVCSRDNFSIRPKSYRLHLSDAGTDANETKIPLLQNNTLARKNLSAEYPYRLDGQAVRNDDTRALGYTKLKNEFTKVEMTDLPDNNSSDIALLQFDDSQSACADLNHTSQSIQFDNGRLLDYNLTHDNAGDYKFWIKDSGWTKVDRAVNNPNKTIFDQNCKESSDPRCNDCIVGSTGIGTVNGKPGCTIGSDIDNDYSTMNLRFYPYAFSLDNALFVTRPNVTSDYLYMNDLSNSDEMAVKVEGNVTAKGKNGTILTNFVQNCAAEDILLSMTRTSLPQEENITTTSGTHVAFQQGIKDTSNVLLVQETTSGEELNSTLQSLNFIKSPGKNGTAKLDMYFNLKKSYSEPIDVVDINFTTLHIVSPDSSSNSNKISNYIPEGNFTINQRRYFYFSRVLPTNNIDNIAVYDLSVSTALKVNIFCQDTALKTCSTLPGISTSAEIIEPTGGGWYRMVNHAPLLDGQINTLTSSVSGVTINPNSYITFDSNGSTSAITIAYPRAGRPVYPVITITPDEWLKYDPIVAKNGLPSFTIRFLNRGFMWKGEGQTGHVIDNNASAAENKRMGW